MSLSVYEDMLGVNSAILFHTLGFGFPSILLISGSSDSGLNEAL